MSIYVPQYKEHDTDAMPNCMCGDQGRNRNESLCKRTNACVGCGFDRREFNRRISLLRAGGLTEMGEKRKEYLRSNFKANTSRPLMTLVVGKKKAADGDE